VRAVRDQGREWSVRSGVDGLVILKTTKSAFTGYIKDKLTTLKPATDRIFGTSATVTWEYSQRLAGLRAGARAHPRSAAQGVCRAPQHERAAYALRHGKSRARRRSRRSRASRSPCPTCTTACRPEPFGQDNPNHIFVPIDEPHGYIEATQWPGELCTTQPFSREQFFHWAPPAIPMLALVCFVRWIHRLPRRQAIRRS
jgi:urate oxidase